MKSKNILLVFFILCSLVCNAQENLVELPIKERIGFAPFGVGLGAMSPILDDEKNPWQKTHLKVLGIPKNWADAKQGEIESNMYQTIYQNYLAANITKELYESTQKSLNWTPDTINLSQKHVKCKIAFAFGKDITGKTAMVVDANNNHDLSDDTIFTPVEIDNDDNVNWDSLCVKNLIMVSLERFSGNKIIMEKAPLFIVYMKKIDRYMSCFPQYATAQLGGAEIVIRSDNFIGLSYYNASLALLNDSLKNVKRINNENLISKREYFMFNGNIYNFKGVNLNKNVLVLEKINIPRNQLYSTQIGYKSFPFEGQIFKSNTNISSNDYKGKYLLLDFWEVWCGPCLQELPNLKTLYDKIDKSKFEIIGIVGDSPSDVLEKMIKENAITWPQILSDDKNKIKEKYNVSSYPTSILINPEGVIVASGLRGKQLEDTITEMIKKE